MLTVPCVHPKAALVQGHYLLWCPECGAIAKLDGGPVSLYEPTEPPPGRTGWFSPILAIESMASTPKITK